MEENNSQGQSYKVSNNNFDQNTIKKKGSKVPIIIISIIAIIVIAIIAIAGFFIMTYSKPENIYKKAIENTIEGYSKKIDKMNYNTSNVNLKIDADIDLKDRYFDEKVLNIINNTKLEFDVQTDNEQEQMFITVDSKYNKDNLINAQMFVDAKEQKTYLKLKDFIKKTIEVDNLDEDVYTYMSEAIKSQKISDSQKKSIKKAMNIIKAELTAIIKPEYCSSSKEEINIDNKMVNATKNTINMTSQQLVKELKTFFKNLKNNQEFINCYEDKDEVEELLEDMIDDIDDIDIEDEKIEISLYTVGLIPQVVKGQIVIEPEKEMAKIEIFSKEKDTINFEISGKNIKEKISGQIKIQKNDEDSGKIILDVNTEELGKIGLDIEYSKKFNEQIDKINTRNSVKSSELTNDDQKEFLENIQNSKLYELIEELSVNTLSPGIETPNFINDEQVFNTNSRTSENEIISYDGKTKVKFRIPQGYKVGYKSDNFKGLEKDNVNISIHTDYTNKEDYYKSLEGNMKSYLTDTFKNANLSKIETKTINGKVFYVATLSYEYNDIYLSDKFETQYIWTEISDDYILEIEISNPNDMNNKDLEDLLSIDITKN